MITAIDKHTALVLIDLQKGVVKAQTVHPIKDILDRAAFLAGAFRQAGLPVILVHVKPAGETPADFADIVPELGQQEGDILILKRNWNAFYNTPLHETLQNLQVTGIVLAGISTSIGVEGTARAASELGYHISFAMDAVTDRLPDAHQHSIKNIFPRIGELSTAAEIANRVWR